MSRHDPAMLDEITGTAEKWLRRCNGMPREGVPTSRRELRPILAMSSAIAADSFGTITWRSEGRVFTAEPVRDGAAGAADH